MQGIAHSGQQVDNSSEAARSAHHCASTVPIGHRNRSIPIKGWSCAACPLQRFLYSTLGCFPTTAGSAQFCLLCCQPEPVPESLPARPPSLTRGCPCSLPVWFGQPIHMACRTYSSPQHSISYTPTRGTERRDAPQMPSARRNWCAIGCYDGPAVPSRMSALLLEPPIAPAHRPLSKRARDDEPCAHVCRADQTRARPSTRAKFRHRDSNPGRSGESRVS